MKFYIQYENRQGVLMRILTEVSRRGIPFVGVDAYNGAVRLEIETVPKQDLQLLRAWRNQIDVLSADQLVP